MEYFLLSFPEIQYGSELYRLQSYVSVENYFFVEIKLPVDRQISIIVRLLTIFFYIVF